MLKELVRKSVGNRETVQGAVSWSHGFALKEGKGAEDRKEVGRDTLSKNSKAGITMQVNACEHACMHTRAKEDHQESLGLPWFTLCFSLPCLCVLTCCMCICADMHVCGGQRKNVGYPAPLLSALFPWGSLKLNLELAFYAQPSNQVSVMSLLSPSTRTRTLKLITEVMPGFTNKTQTNKKLKQPPPPPTTKTRLMGAGDPESVTYDCRGFLSHWETPQPRYSEWYKEIKWDRIGDIPLTDHSITVRLDRWRGSRRWFSQ